MPFSHSEQFAIKAIQELYTKSEHIDCAYDTIKLKSLIYTLMLYKSSMNNL